LKGTHFVLIAIVFQIFEAQINSVEHNLSWKLGMWRLLKKDDPHMLDLNKKRLENCVRLE